MRVFHLPCLPPAHKDEWRSTSLPVVCFRECNPAGTLITTNARVVSLRVSHSYWEPTWPSTTTRIAVVLHLVEWPAAHIGKFESTTHGRPTTTVVQGMVTILTSRAYRETPRPIDHFVHVLSLSPPFSYSSWKCMREGGWEKYYA